MGNMLEIMGAAARSSGMGAMGSLTSYPLVTVFQNRMVFDQDYSRRTGGITFSGSLAPEGADGVYGDKTHNMALNWIDWMVRTGACAGTSRVEWTRNGPNAARDCILAHGGDAALVDALQRAWNEWKDASSPGGGGGAAPPAPGVGPATPPAVQTTVSPSTDWSTGEKVLFGLGVAGVAGLLLWLIFGDHDD